MDNNAAPTEAAKGTSHLFFFRFGCVALLIFSFELGDFGGLFAALPRT